MSWVHRTALAGLSLLVSLVSAHAQEPAATHHAQEARMPFHAAGLLGESHSGERNGVTMGGDFEFRFSRPLGIGVTGEHVNEPFRENVWIVPLLIHPVGGLKLTVGPGFERVREDGAEAIEQRALWRAGVGYDIAMKHGWTVGPDVAVDFVAGEKVLVYAVAIGREFGRR